MVAVVVEPAPRMRIMRREDLAQVMEIETAAYEFSWTPAIMRDCLHAGYECWVLADAERIVGYGVLSVAAGEAHLLNVCVARAEQGQGHGRRLLRRLIDIARWHAAERLYLEVRPSNRVAVALYDDMGFNEIGRRPNYYPARREREDALVMAMELLPAEPD